MHIAIAGNIGAGKTTLTKSLGKHYKYEVEFEDVVDNPYLDDFYNQMERWSFNLQIYFLNSRFRQLRDIIKEEMTRVIHEIAVDVGAESIRGSMTGKGVEAFSVQAKDQILFYKNGKPVGTIQLPSNDVSTVRNTINLSNAMKDHGVAGLEQADIEGPGDVNKLYVV